MLSKHPPDKLNYGREFQEHIRGFEETCDAYKGDMEEAFSHEIELWVIGASDHLYEMETPALITWNHIRLKVEELRSFTSHKKWTMEDFRKLLLLTHEISLMIDETLGLKPEVGIHG